MLIFDENRMSKAKFNRSIVLQGGSCGIAIMADYDEVPIDEFAETEVDQECWVISDIFSEDCNNGSMLFVYIPEFDMATTILSRFITIGS